MNFKAFFAPEVGIRLTEDLNGFVCTVRRGLFRKESSECVFDPNPDSLPEPLNYSIRRSWSYRVVVPRPRQKDSRL